ncbi:hypothetical protein PAE9249_05332 [Paenibacillus sp. CECT 9249]|uniref:GNAT family N-acetyltransferase n=1 Tax=Paenibacillus sp. CECT 9249 TaxID=2845385 RepID=UPI001E59FA5B|nr:GNAT family protein [Paenibacillus sp. CECT 9249]CAH0122741.1 hypothetical protein PAE9249_05332 [Paenibacillus sp. CECT 9249]
MKSAQPHLRTVPLQETHAEAICNWVYEPPYDLYGWLPWPQMQALGVEFGDPDVRRQQYAAVVDSAGELIGFAQFFPLVGVTRLGIGMRPDLCGQGLGTLFMMPIIAEAKRRAPENAIDLEVHVWNERAIRVYERVGFRITDTYEKRTPDGYRPFHCMVFQG